MSSYQKLFKQCFQKVSLLATVSSLRIKAKLCFYVAMSASAVLLYVPLLDLIAAESGPN